MKKKDANNKIIIIKFDCNIIKDKNVTAELLSSEHFFKHLIHCKDAADQLLESFL